MIQVNRIYLIFNRLVTKKFLVDTSDTEFKMMNNYFFRLMLYTKKVPHPEKAALLHLSLQSAANICLLF